MLHRVSIIFLLIISIVGASSCGADKAKNDRIDLLAREAILRDSLFQFRKVIDIYAADKGELPQSLEDLVKAGYLREVPTDPITKKKDWKIITGDDPNSSTGGKGIVDVQSASPVYSNW